MKLEDLLKPKKVEYVEYKENPCMQPFETTCPKCHARIIGDAPQINIICPKCGVELVRKGFDTNQLFVR